MNLTPNNPPQISNGSGPREWDRRDTWHVIEKSAMCFVALAPLDLFEAGHFDWSLVLHALTVSLLMGAQMVVRQFLFDNRVKLPELPPPKVKTPPPVFIPRPPISGNH